MSGVPEVRYARSGEIDIAYQIIGDGPVDLVYVPGFVSHLDLIWEIPQLSARYKRFESIARVLTFDKRGTGLSDRTLGFGSIAERMDDIRAVMDASGFERAALYGVSEGGPMAILFAATYPDRVTKLVLQGTFAKGYRSDDYPDGFDPRVVERGLEFFRDNWGTGKVMQSFISDAPDEALPLLARYERSACTRQMMDEILHKNVAIDVRAALPAIGVPTLVMHFDGDPIVNVEHGRYLKDHIRGARYEEFTGNVHGRWGADRPETPMVREFLLGEAAPTLDSDRVLATVLFTDIVRSTERAASLGDQSWRDLLDQHDAIARTRIDRFSGRLVKATGDGLLATFDGPARAIACAQEIANATRPLGLEIRAGLHTGEVELRSDDIAGLGVVIARRICDLAGDGELLTSRTVKDLVTGSKIAFTDRGTQSLKGVPEDWQLYAVTT